MFFSLVCVINKYSMISPAPTGWLYLQLTLTVWTSIIICENNFRNIPYSFTPWQDITRRKGWTSGIIYCKNCYAMTIITCHWMLSDLGFQFEWPMLSSFLSLLCQLVDHGNISSGTQCYTTMRWQQFDPFLSTHLPRVLSELFV